MLTDQQRKFLPRIPRYCREDDIESNYYNFNPRLNNIINNVEEEEEDSDEEVMEVRSGSNELDKWDKGARSWLSGGTMFLLIVLFHVIQVRSDLRRFTTAANVQIEEACGVLEDKTVSLQTALGLAVKDIGPITLKFVRDLKSKVRAAFYFAAQIFGGRIRSYYMSLMSYRYCLLVGMTTVINSLMNSSLNFLKFYCSDSFFTNLINILQSATNLISDIVTNPEKVINAVIQKLLDFIFDIDLLSIEVPEIIVGNSSEICSRLKKLNFEEINLLLQSYIKKIIVLLTVMLVLFNTFQFISVVDSESSKKEKEENKSQQEEEEDEETLSIFSDDSDEILNNKEGNNSSCAKNATVWFFRFLSFDSFWIFLTMGVFGLLHVHFSHSLVLKAKEIKKTVIDPQIDIISSEFMKEVTDFLVSIEESWKSLFRSVFSPITNFIESLSNILGPILSEIKEAFSPVIDQIDNFINYFNLISCVESSIKAMIDCFFLSKMKMFLNIAKFIKDKLTKSNWNKFDGGIVHLLKNSIVSIFRKLKLTKYLKKLLSVSFLMFLRLVTKRSVFLYVYLIVCAILISQGILLMIIKLILGYF